MTNMTKFLGKYSAKYSYIKKYRYDGKDEIGARFSNIEINDINKIKCSAAISDSEKFFFMTPDIVPSSTLFAGGDIQ